MSWNEELNLARVSFDSEIIHIREKKRVEYHELIARLMRNLVQDAFAKYASEEVQIVLDRPEDYDDYPYSYDGWFYALGRVVFRDAQFSRQHGDWANELEKDVSRFVEENTSDLSELMGVCSTIYLFRDGTFKIEL